LASAVEFIDVGIKRSYIIGMRITCDPAKRAWTLRVRGLDMRRANEVFAGTHLTRPDNRHDYGESRFVTVGWLDERLVVFVWTPRGAARRVISMRHCHEREAKKVRPYFS
jgi:uncharacterized protein